MKKSNVIELEGRAASLDPLTGARQLTQQTAERAWYAIARNFAAAEFEALAVGILATRGCAWVAADAVVIDLSD